MGSFPSVFQGGAAPLIKRSQFLSGADGVVNKRSRSAPYFCLNLLTTPSAPLRNGIFLLRRSHPSLKTEGNEPVSTVTPPQARSGSGPVDNQRKHEDNPVVNQQESDCMPHDKSEILQGTLDLMILQSLASMGPLHGWGIARRLEQISEDLLFLNQGTIYPALVRLEQRGWIKSEWGVSENNRRAKYFDITRAGRRQLAKEVDNWWRIASTISRLLPKPE